MDLSCHLARQKWRFSNDEDEGGEEEPNPNKKLPCSPCSAEVTSQPDFTIDSGQCPRLKEILDAFYQHQFQKNHDETIAPEEERKKNRLLRSKPIGGIVIRRDNEIHYI